jgi:hypothetical protein
MVIVVKKRSKWYAVQVSDTTMLINAAALFGQKKSEK